VKLEVVTIGTELVLGLTPDTNAAELGRALAAAGAEIVRHSCVPDRPDAIRAAVADALERTGFVITTGGLGPTRDDMTKREVAALLGKPLQLDARVLRSLEERFRRLGRPMPAVNRTQAEVPAGATVLPNPRGTAPGLWLEEAGRVVVLLPGVPSEMRGLLADEVLPRIVARAHQGTRGADRRVVRSRTVRTSGVPESALAERVGPIEEEIAPLTLAYVPSTDGVDLRVTAWALPEHEADQRLATAAGRLRERAGEHCYGEEGADLAAVVLDRLRVRGARLAVAESCTGGLLAGRVTAVPGASDVFVGGVVAYDDRVKTDLLAVPRDLLAAHGAVSEEVVRAMAEGAQRRFAVDAALAVTGIAGPAGGTPEKPVGTVWLAARFSAGARAVKRIFPGDRGEIRARSAQAALDLLRRLLDESRERP
jgi:nicotinamide-nucleotide amidase